jgi:glycosyltransferase involved in cell wall biosynthesis
MPFGGGYRIAYITAGAAGMYCGSCMHDNTLVATLHRLGHEALLIPTYTPIRTDEPDVSQHRVFLGGINMYLQQKLSLFRHTPWLLDRPLDAAWLLRRVSRFAVRTQAQELGDLFVSVLKGEHGHQKKEIEKLVRWLATEVKPHIVNLTNVLLSGLVRPIKEKLGVPVVATLQGDDVFLDALPESYRSRALDLIRDHCADIDGFIATCRYYADSMGNLFGLPIERRHVVYPGLDLRGHSGALAHTNSEPFTIGYFARICPEKGFHVLVDAFLRLRKLQEAPPCRLRVSGWLGENNRAYYNEQRQRIDTAGLAESFEHVESPDHASKVHFLQSLDVLSVPTTYREPKGLYVLEALANGVPVVQPRHGSFPELIEATGGGLLVEPGDSAGLAEALRILAMEPERGREMGRKGQQAVRDRFTAERMTRETIAVYEHYLKGRT